MAPLAGGTAPQKEKEAPPAAIASDVIAWVIDVKSSVKIQRVGRKPVELKPKQGQYQPLHEGDKLIFDSKGELAYRLVSSDPKATPRVLKKLGDTSVYTLQKPADKTPAYVTKMNNRIGYMGGSPLSGDTFLLSPAEDSVMRAEYFAIRWKLPKNAKTLTIKIINTDQEVWRNDNIDASSGALPDSALQEIRSLLMPLTATNSKIHISVAMRTGEEKFAMTSCTLLTPANEKRLIEELKRWRDLETDAVLYQMKVGQIKSGYGLSNEASDAWDAALVQSPESEFILLKTIEAHRAIKDREGAEKLQARLAALTSDSVNRP